MPGPQADWSAGAIVVLATALTALLVVLALLLRRQRRDRRRLAAAEREKALILAGISDRVTYLDRELNIVWTNWTDEDGQPRPGRPCHEVIASRDTPCRGCPATEVLRTGKSCEGVVTCDDGRVLRMVAAAVRDDAGGIIGVVQTSRDITEKRRLAERLKTTQKTEAVGRLAAGVAHDFNNSLQVLLGYAEMLRDQVSPGSEADGYLQSMLRAGGQARDVVRQLLTFSRKRPPCFELLDLAGYLREKVDALERLMGEGIEIELSAPADLPWVTADPSQLEQVLLNLCVNARDAMPAGGALRLSLVSEDLDAEEAARRGAPVAGSYVLLCVRDDGEGIAPEIQDRIFDPFFTTKEVDRGTGLGLATVQGIVTAHQGFVELASKPRRGTCFRVGWPAGAVLPDGRVAPARAEIDAPTGCVLVVEDSQPVRELAVEVLVRYGHRVDTAADGRQALDILLRDGDRYDVVVMDVMLPGLNGWSVYTKASARHPRLRAVFCSGQGPALLETEFRMDIPELEYLQKPYRPAELLASVNALLARNGLRAEEAAG
jgi:signal transduction histidine kinase/CheY-like chemotaxis protein